MDINFQRSKNTTQKLLWPFSFELNRKTAFFYVVCEFSSSCERAGLNVNVSFCPAKTSCTDGRDNMNRFPTQNLKETLSKSPRVARGKNVFVPNGRQNISIKLGTTNSRRRTKCIAVDEHSIMQKRLNAKSLPLSDGNFLDHSGVHFPSRKSPSTMLYSNDKRTQPFQIYAQRIHFTFNEARMQISREKNCQKKFFYFWRS